LGAYHLSRSSLAHHNAVLYTCQNCLVEIYVHIWVDGWERGMKPSPELQMTQIMMSAAAPGPHLDQGLQISGIRLGGCDPLPP
jgi:hypothetical protein